MTGSACQGSGGSSSSSWGERAWSLLRIDHHERVGVLRRLVGHFVAVQRDRLLNGENCVG